MEMEDMEGDLPRLFCTFPKLISKIKPLFKYITSFHGYNLLNLPISGLGTPKFHIKEWKKIDIFPADQSIADTKTILSCKFMINNKKAFTKTSFSDNTLSSFSIFGTRSLFQLRFLPFLRPCWRQDNGAEEKFDCSTQPISANLIDFSLDFNVSCWL